MDEITKNRIDAVRSEVAKSDLEPETKDALQARLDHAHRCSNGTPDKIKAISEATADGIIFDVRQVVRQDERVRTVVSETVTEAITKHLQDCPLRTQRELPPTAQAAEQSQFIGKLGAAGRAFEKLTTEGRIAIIFVVLWAVKTYGLDTVLGWIKNLLA
jgi:hypothetical protein